jgi:hypothetical protein
MRKKVTLEVRFWAKVIIPENPDDCYLWTAYKNKDGYGCISTGIKRGATDLSHRISWLLEHGTLPKKESGLEICHSCGNRSCVNPRHLRLGTHQDNMDDLFVRSDRGILTRKRGSSHGRAKFTEDQIRLVRRQFDAGSKTVTQLAREYSVNYKTMNDIVLRNHWKQVL